MSERGSSGNVWVTLSNNLKATVDSPSIPGRLLFVFAHPDDETIAASMLLARAEEAHLIYLTDGAPRDRRFWSPDATGERSDYANLRRQEAVQAVALAGIEEQEIEWLNAVDQEAIASWESLARSTGEVIARKRPDAIVTHTYEGGHPDHDAAALIARRAVEDASDRGVQCELLEVPLYHARDGQLICGEFLDSLQDGSPWPTELTIPLSATDMQRKRQMLNSHGSQWRVLQAFPLEVERIRPAPDYDFTQPPHAGKLWYECMGWPTTGAAWRQLAAGNPVTSQK
jgi:LmbE family N-acetylglucosaminyl deacetylase